MSEEPFNKDEPPDSFGVIKPLGHVVIAFERLDNLREAHEALRALGFGDMELVRYSADEMKKQLDEQLQSATGVADLGYEIVLARHHRRLADLGCEWLIVHAPQEDRSAQVADVARQHGAALADRYGTLVIEQMLQSPTA